MKSKRRRVGKGAANSTDRSAPAKPGAVPTRRRMQWAALVTRGHGAQERAHKPVEDGRLTP